MEASFSSRGRRLSMVSRSASASSASITPMSPAGSESEPTWTTLSESKARTT